MLAKIVPLHCLASGGGWSLSTIVPPPKNDVFFDERLVVMALRKRSFDGEL